MDNAKLLKHSSEQNISDWISGLPDSVLLHILSFLKMDDVIKTSVLSRRWRYLWTFIPCMDFETGMIPEMHFVAFVDRSLVLHEGSKVKKIRIFFERKSSHDVQVDSWIRFVVGCHVEEFQLDFIGEMDYPEPVVENFYKLPHSLFNCQSLRNLTLKFCDLNLPASMCLSLLKTLSLDIVELSTDTIKDLTSGCPLLEYLSLRGCNWRSDLNIYVINPNIKSLEIEDCNDCNWNTEFKIYAPNLPSLNIINMPRSNYRVKRLSSLISASFAFDGQDMVCDEHDGDELVKLLNDLHHVKDLKLCDWCLGALSVREVQSFPALSLNVTCLKLKTAYTRSDLNGIAYMLKSCPNLETLVISRDWIIHHYSEYWKSQDLDFSSLLQNLKTVKIFDFLKKYTPPVTNGTDSTEDGTDAIEELYKRHENEIEFVRFLLKNCKVLKRMIVSTPTKNHFNQLEGKALELPLKLSQKLLNFPRTSPDAEIIFSYCFVW